MRSMSLGDKEHRVRFSTLQEDGSETNVRMIRQSAMAACPHFIMVPEHYRTDESCRCDDPEHSEMAAWGYMWDGARWIAAPLCALCGGSLDDGDRGGARSETLTWRGYEPICDACAADAN